MSEDNKVLTIGIFAHANAGKTTITEHLLYHTNVIDKIGRVDNGDTVTDSMSVERERGISVRDALVSFLLDETKIQLIDTPGHIDFSAEVERAISVLDGAVLVISGVEGLEAQTYTIWRALKEKNVPVIIFINKMDRKGANYNKVIEALKTNLNIPTVTLKDIKQNIEGRIEISSSKIDDLIIDVANVDDEVFELYASNRAISDKYLDEKIVKLIKDRKLYPVIGGSALADIGISDLVTCIGKYIPETNKLNNEDFSAFVYAIRVNDNVKNAYVKILKGTLENRSTIKIDDELNGKVKGIMIPNGSKLIPTNMVETGDIAILSGLDVKCGQILGDRSSFDKYISFVNPLLTMEVSPKQKSDLIELMNALRVLNDEDPYLNLRYDEKTNSIYVSLMGEVQAQIIENMLSERFNIGVNMEHPIVIRKEVPTVTAEARATYTSVSGIGLCVSPLPRGSGLKYVSKVSTDYLHLKYQRQVERLIKYYSKQGLYGWELTDIEIALIDGQFDSMGSDPMHFNIITPLALFRCLKQAKIKLLEPVCKYIIKLPDEYLSLVTKSLTNKNSAFEIIKNEDETNIEGEVAISNMLNYPLELSKITSGRGSFSSYLSRYEISQNQEEMNNYIGADPRNEVTFIISDMHASLEPLDRSLMKKKKESRSKFQRIQKEKRSL